MAEASSAPGSGKLTTLSSHQAVNDASTAWGLISAA
jgi:protein transport protein HofQ